MQFMELRDSLKNKSLAKPEPAIVVLARALNCIKEK
jgi:hypothetical protein